MFNTHLASHDADERIAQAKRVSDRLRADPAPLKIVTGDLNTTDSSDVEVLREFRTVGLADPGGVRWPGALELDAWAAYARAARSRLFTQDDLATQLLGFVGKKR